MVTFRRVDWETQSEEDFIFNGNDWYRTRFGEDFTDDQIEWMRIIYQEYADEEGEIDWTHDMDNEAWYYYMSEVLGFDDETIERYVET